MRQEKRVHILDHEKLQQVSHNLQSLHDTEYPQKKVEERLCADNEKSEERWKASSEEWQRTVKGSRKPRKVRKSFKKGQKNASDE